jgi:antitoxin ParD1/3/4
MTNKTYPKAETRKANLSSTSAKNIRLPGAPKAFVNEQDASGDASDEYVCELIRLDQDRQRLRKLLLDGATSPPTAPADKAYFEALRERIRR